MKIFIAADHGGFGLKEKLVRWLREQKHDVEDCGAFKLEGGDDYPDFAFRVAEKVAKAKHSRGILICRSGAGMSIAANKVKGIRAMFAYDEKSVRHGVEHDNVNVISLSGDWLGEDRAKRIIDVFFQSRFDNQEKRKRRIRKITNYSNS
ncbi:MAG: RpiB/LacA/LacB family sugar-phosphate isomerase [Patescibacteria group bacterium]